MTIKEMGVKIRDELCVAASLPGSGSPVTEPIAAILKRPVKRSRVLLGNHTEDLYLDRTLARRTDGGGGGVASVRLKAEEVSLGSGNTATKTNKQSDTNTTVKLDHLTTVGGVRGASNVQTIQVSTAAGGVQTIKVALPPGTQTLAKVTPHQLAKVASQAVSRGSGSGAVKGAVAMKGTHIQTAVGGTNITPDTLLNTQHITALTQGGVVVSGGGSGNKTRSPIVTLTTREAARLTPHSPTPTTTTTTTPSPTTHHHHHHHHHTQSSGSSVGVGKLTTTQQQQASPTTHKSTTTSLFSLGGIKLLQAAPQQLTGKVRSNSPSVANSITKLQTLVVDGKVLMQGAKAMSGGGVGNTGKQQVITGVFPGQQLTTVESLLSQGDKAPQIQGGVITTLAGNKLTGGNVIQVGSGSGNSGVQRLTLVSPGASHHVPLTAASQRLILATASQAGKLDPSSINKTQVVQTIQTLQPAVLQTNQHHTTTNTHTSATANTHTSAANTTQARFFSVGQHHQKAIVQGLNVGGKPSVLSASGLRLMQPGVVGGAGAGAGGGGGVGGGGTAAPTTGNLITIGGKQVLLTSKPFSQQGQLQQVMLTSGGGGSSISQQSSSSSNSNSSSGTVVVASGAGGQIVLPASALQGSQLNLKGLQAFHTLKVIPASQVTPQQRGKPVLARLVSPAAVRTANIPTNTTNITTQQHDANTKS
ncbi:hypothetical protein Pcinc_003651 [Petrolisthes cinctipes]|uniref:Uncharacterized protein n=1 Tax=Petrolisthes cinctipes TaxID=88211 RepID=A0AAE1L1T2_PETCI|nr:hypothetical protein Pcinc_003651 [Petrolisthes cinctipes]